MPSNDAPEVWRRSAHSKVAESLHNIVNCAVAPLPEVSENALSVGRGNEGRTTCGRRNDGRTISPQRSTSAKSSRSTANTTKDLQPQRQQLLTETTKGTTRFLSRPSSRRTVAVVKPATPTLGRTLRPQPERSRGNREALTGPHARVETPGCGDGRLIVK